MMSFSIRAYFDLLKELLGDKGCIWSKSQTPATLCHYVIEETYEVLDAEKKEDPSKVEEELGDLLFTLSFLLKLVFEKYGLRFDEVVRKGAEKIERRHPHVFENPQSLTLEELREQWEASKAKERQQKKESPLTSVASSLPVLNRAMKWAELTHKYGYPYFSKKESLADRFLDLIFEGASQFENMDILLEDKLRELEEGFKGWMEKENLES